MLRTSLEILGLFIICLIMLVLTFIWVFCMIGLVFYACINVLMRRSSLLVRSRRA